MRKKAKSVEEFRCRPASLIIMCHDPGTTSYGYSIIRASSVSRGLKPDVKIKVLTNGLCQNLVKELKSGRVLRTTLEAHNQWARKLEKKFKVQFVAAERYMARGGKGPTIEAVNMMLGKLIHWDMPCKVIPASQWKNAVRRANVELDTWYKWAKVTPHQLDACLIGVYMSSVLYGHKGFDGLNLERQIKPLILQMEKVSQERLINRKTRA